jgi:hypothetical protein
MSFAQRLRPPISTRHAFALAFDLALRRDALHSIVVPFLLHAPWVLALVLLPASDEAERPTEVTLWRSVALLGGSITWSAVCAMLRIRARSVFNTPAGARPAAVGECYAIGLRRLPWLYLTEFVRGAALAFAFPFFVLPGVFLAYRLAFSTEAVVLDDRNLADAFQHSFRLAKGRFERWLELMVLSVLILLGAMFLATLLWVVLPGGVSWSSWKVAATLFVISLWPIIQYAWTFFYLRLVEVETPVGVEVGPLYAGVPEPHAPTWTPTPPSGSHLSLVEPPRASDSAGENRST